MDLLECHCISLTRIKVNVGSFMFRTVIISLTWLKVNADSFMLTTDTTFLSEGYKLF